MGKAFFLCKRNGDGADWQRNSTLRIDASLRREDLDLRMEAGAIYGKGGGGNGRQRDALAA
jgi:hypothetical protein